MKRKILIVEDDEVLRGVLDLVLRRAGYEVEAVENGLYAIESVSRAPVDLVITDLIMPVQEGIETIVALRRLIPDIPIIAISGGGSGESMGYLKMARGLGARETLAKPFHPDVLLDAVTRCLPPGD